MSDDIAVVGGGTVGAAITFGLVRAGANVVMIDGADNDHRAATANFGLVWQHGKGIGIPAYQALTRASVAARPSFARELAEAAPIDLQLEQNGGLVLCLGNDGFAARRGSLMRLHNEAPDECADWEMLTRSELEKLLPKAKLGADVVGASLGRKTVG